MTAIKIVGSVLTIAVICAIGIVAYTASYNAGKSTVSTSSERISRGDNWNSDNNNWDWSYWYGNGNGEDDDDNYDSYNPFNPPANSGGWPAWGRDYWNTHYQPAEKKINTANVNTLVLRCNFNTTGSIVNEVVTTGDNYLYVSAGTYVYAINRFTCAVLWTFNVTDALSAFNFSLCPSRTGPFLPTINRSVRSSPTIDKNYIYVGSGTGAYVLKIDRYSGVLVASKQIETHCLAQLTAAGVVRGNSVWFGVSSGEENAVLTYAAKGYQCCTFRGSVVQLSLKDLSIISKTYTMPPNNGVAGGFGGGAVWGSAFAVDLDTQRLYLATGNQYSVPARQELCRSMVNDPNATITFKGQNYSLPLDVISQDPCKDANDHGEAMVGIRTLDGVITFSTSLTVTDSYNTGCGLIDPHDGIILNRIPTFCPQLPGPDFDYGNAPIFIKGSKYTPGGFNVIIAGQKSGNVNCLLAESGRLVWSTNVGPAGFFGGLQWGMASNGKSVFYHMTDSLFVNYTIFQDGQNITINYPSYGAINISTGLITWTRAAPTQGIGFGLLSVANNVLYATSMDGSQSTPTQLDKGSVHFLDATTGAVLGRIEAGLGSSFGVTLPGDGSMITTAGVHPWKSGRVSVFSLPNDRRF